MKTNRHAKLLELIAEYEIETQEELTNRLQSAGFAVTQATVSRDMKELGLIKVRASSGGYQYAVAAEPPKPIITQFDSLFASAIESIEPAMHMIAVKCLPGMAQAVCVAIEGLYLDGVVGTLAGDDTIFILCKDNAAANATTVALKNMTRG